MHEINYLAEPLDQREDRVTGRTMKRSVPIHMNLYLLTEEPRDQRHVLSVIIVDEKLQRLKAPTGVVRNPVTLTENQLL